tara:strand:- start:159 stop:788 length:630 start_codon:yes stop_codon:yes gene_type:complete
MKNLNKIKETLFKIEPKNISFVKKLLPVIAEEIDCGGYNYAYAIYIDDSKPCIDGYIYKGDDKEKTFKSSKKFRKWLESNKPKCFKDILFCFDTYFCGRKGRMDKINLKKPSFKANPVVDDLLRESNGFLLWDYQIIKLYCLFDLDREKADMFRKYFNKKRREFEEIAGKLLFNNGMTLKDVIWERSILGVVKAPNLKGSYDLYKLLFE